MNRFCKRIFFIVMLNIQQSFLFLLKENILEERNALICGFLFDSFLSFFF